MKTTTESLRGESLRDDELEAPYEILSDLLASAALDPLSEGRDCLEHFNEYEWQMISGKDTDRFQLLLAKGNEGTMTSSELNEFMAMVSQEGQLHLYYTLWIGHQIVVDFKRRTCSNK